LLACERAVVDWPVRIDERGPGAWTGRAAHVPDIALGRSKAESVKVEDDRAPGSGSGEREVGAAEVAVG
jgi:hypothetical protein